jgi:hypothetical protein
MKRLVIVPDESHEALAAVLKSRLAGIVRELDAENLVDAMGIHAPAVLVRSADGMAGVEWVLWAGGGGDFAVAWTSAEPVDEVVGRVRADAGEGLVARVFASWRSELEMRDELQAGDWTNFERLRGRGIGAMAGSPVVVFGVCVAVLSVVVFVDFEGDGVVRPPAETASLLGRLVEDRLLRATLGMDAS